MVLVIGNRILESKLVDRHCSRRSPGKRPLGMPRSTDKWQQEFAQKALQQPAKPAAAEQGSMPVWYYLSRRALSLTVTM